ncbi:MAG: hypothetical protein EOO75_20945 [Myxococcales bacterium]|nr:MAG: hypothetical protein EOO75_20945 [Myxococcales bacterium]
MRSDEESCAPAQSPVAWSLLGCQIAPGNGAYAYQVGPQCCYATFCGEGRPLYVDGLLTRAPAQRRGDWG